MPAPRPSLEDEWRARLLGTSPALRAGRRFFAMLPSPPRCELCAAPFEGPFAPVLRLMGKGRFVRNPRYCVGCCAELLEHKGGVEIPLSFLFADVRGSTGLGERLGPKGLHELMGRFYTSGVEALIAHGAIVDRFMGDQVVGYFPPGFAGPLHARQAVRCGLAILRATGHAQEAPWVPVGVGVHTGEAFIGAVGKGDDLVEVTALGEAVNLAARLASAAAIGELLASEAAVDVSGIGGEAERRVLSLKGITAPVAVRVLRVDSA